MTSSSNVLHEPLEVLSSPHAFNLNSAERSVCGKFANIRPKCLLQQETAQLVGDQSARLRLESSNHSQINQRCCKLGLSLHKTWAVGQNVVLWLTNEGRQSLVDWAEAILRLLEELSPMPWQLTLYDSMSGLYRTAGTCYWIPILHAFQHFNINTETGWLLIAAGNG